MERSQPFVSSWDNVVSDGRNELVFEDKNKEYGAYVIRKKYNSSLLIGILVSAFILTLAVAIPLINTLWNTEEEKPKEEYKEVVSNMADLLPKEKVLPLTLPPPPPPPVLEKLKFTIVEVTEEKVEEPIVTQTAANDKKLGEETVKGDPDATDLGDIEQSNDLIGSEVVVSYPVNVDKAAIPGGGWDAFTNYIIDNFDKNLLTVSEINNGIDVYVKISVTGELMEVTINRSCGNKTLDAEALRDIKSYKKKWTPAMINGRPSPSARLLPLVFPVEGEE